MPTAAELGVQDVLHVVEHLYGLEGDREGDEYKMLCINPQHHETRPSFSVNLVTGYHHCYSCGKGGDLAELGVLALGRKRHEVLDLLRPSSIEGMVDTVRSRLASIGLPARRRQPPPNERGPYEPGPLQYLRRRGFTTATLERWGVRFVPEETLKGHKGEFQIRSAVGIPIRDEHQRLLAWCYRATPSSGDWWRYMYDREVAHLWFGMHLHHQAGEVAIVEGALDALWLDQCGFPALGLLGAGMAGGKKALASKVSRLQRFESLVLVGDRDAGGELWVRAIGEALGERMPIRVALYSKWMTAGDPQELAPVDLELMMDRAIPWSRFRLRLLGRSA